MKVFERLYFESVAELRRAGNFAMITLVDGKRQWQINIVTDTAIMEQLVMRMHASGRPFRNRLPEVVCAMLCDVTARDEYSVEISEVNDGEYISEVVRGANGEGGRYRIRISDAVLLSEIMGIPIYISQELMKRQRTRFTGHRTGSTSLPINIMPESALRENLKKAIEMEDYEMAKIISDELHSRHADTGLEDDEEKE